MSIAPEQASLFVTTQIGGLGVLAIVAFSNPLLGTQNLAIRVAEADFRCPLTADGLLDGLVVSGHFLLADRGHAD